MLTDPKTKRYHLIIDVPAGSKGSAHVKITEGMNIYQRGDVRFCLLDSLMREVRDAATDDDLSRIAENYNLKMPPRG